MTDARTVDLVIGSIGGRGDGIAMLDGRRVYVPLTVPGDRVRARLGASRADGVAAELVEVLEPGPARTQAPCAHFGACGGCALQHMDPAAYAAWKREQVVTALARQGLGEVEVTPARVVPAATRRRATVAVQRRGRRLRLGFNARASHRLVEVPGCHVLDPAIVRLFDPLREALGSALVDGDSCDATLTRTEDGMDVLLVGPGRLGLDARLDLGAFAESQDLARLSWRPSLKAPVEPIAHRRPARVRFGGVPVEIPPGGFLQAAPEGEAALVEEVLAAVGSAARVADLFAGSGTFTFPLSARASVMAVEGDGEAVAALHRAARLNGLDAQVTAERRDLFRDPLPPAALARFDAVVFDPPRAGAAAQVAELASATPGVVVGVSCSPGTFARDARTLVDGGWRLERVVPVDQFLWSPHVELVGTFRR